MSTATAAPTGQTITLHGRECYIRAHDTHLSVSDWTLGSVSHWIGKCRVCKRATRVAVQQQVRLMPEWSAGDTLYIAIRTYQYNAISAGAQYHASRQGAYVTATCQYGCVARGYPALLTCKRIDGHHNPGVPCHAKCTGATGPNCECSCAGANHGSAHGG